MNHLENFLKKPFKIDLCWEERTAKLDTLYALYSTDTDMRVPSIGLTLMFLLQMSGINLILQYTGIDQLTLIHGACQLIDYTGLAGLFSPTTVGFLNPRPQCSARGIVLLCKATVTPP